MAYIFVENFKLGMDRKQSRVSGAPGSLWDLKNGRITRGGEIESRKSFVEKYALPLGTFGCHALAGEVYVFGSGVEPVGLPAGVIYQQLAHPDGTASMSRLLRAENFDGKIYAIAEFFDDEVFHYYNGQRVTKWDGIAITVNDNDSVARSLALQIDASVDFTASEASNVVTITAATPGEAFTISAFTLNYGSVNDQLITLAQTQANVEAVAEVAPTASFVITGGSAGGGNTVSNVKIDGIDLMSGSVAWTTSNANTASLVAAAINSHASSPDYTAAAVGPTVTITAAAGVGATGNGLVLSVTVGGTVTVGSLLNMAGGVTAVAAVAQTYTATITGTFEDADVFGILLNGDEFSTSGQSAGPGRTALAFKNKMYSTTSTLVYFSALNIPTQWGSGTGSGFISISSGDSGSDELTAIEAYQNFLAIFAREAVQIYFMDPDPALNTQIQVLSNTGTRSPLSVIQFGNNDVFYLSDSGVRSLRARDSSNAAYVNDVGTAIDTPLLEYLKTLTDAQIERAVAILEPESDRYWLAVGDRLWEFSFFPTAKISAWSYSEPGFEISDMTRSRGQLFVRSGDTIYLYGGDDGTTFPDEDEAPVVVKLPFLDAKKPGHKKMCIGVDLACEGTWNVRALIDPKEEAEGTYDYIDLGTFTGTTYHKLREGAQFEFSHIALELTCASGGHARLINLCIHYDGENEPG
jgi:hypothetical protein